MMSVLLFFVLSILVCILVIFSSKVKVYFITRKTGKKIRSRILPSPSKGIRIDGITDYRVYKMSIRQKAGYTAIAAAAVVTLSQMFFRSPGITAVMLPLALLYPPVVKKKLLIERRKKLTLQFKDLLYSLSSSLSAGKSMEAALYSAMTDLAILYPDRNSHILKELDLILRRLDMNDTAVNALKDFALRAGDEDIGGFVELISVCRSTGGNLVGVVRNAADIICQKAEILNEIDVITAEQKMSQKILGIMPFALLGFISAGSPDYIAPLFSPVGHAVMFTVLVMLVLSYYLGVRIADIRV